METPIDPATPASPAAAQPLRLTSLTQIEELLEKPVGCQFYIGAQLVEVPVRALNGEQWAGIQKIADGVKPPKKEKPPGARPGEEEYDVENPDYLAALEAAGEKMVTLALEMAVVGMQFPGGTIEEKITWRRQHFPPQVTNTLYAFIKGLTVDPAKLAGLAHFTGGA